MEEWAGIRGIVVMLPCQHIVCGPCMLSWAQGRKQGFSADDVHQAIEHLASTYPCCRAHVLGGLRAIQALVTSSVGAKDSGMTRDKVREALHLKSAVHS